MEKRLKEILEEEKKDPKVTILKSFTGMEAFCVGADLFFLNDSEEEKQKWIKQFSLSDKKHTIAYFYKRKKIKNYDLKFRFITHDAYLGERKPLEEGLQKWAQFLH